MDKFTIKILFSGQCVIELYVADLMYNIGSLMPKSRWDAIAYMQGQELGPLQEAEKNDEDRFFSVSHSGYLEEEFRGEL